MKRVFIIHGWDGYPEEGWFPWLKKELETKGFKVVVPQMPDPANPRIHNWVPKLVEVATLPDEETYFVGHSMGCQTIARYLESLPPKTKVGGAVFVAGFFKRLTGLEDDEDVQKTDKHWLGTPLDLKRVKTHLLKSVAIFLDNDPYVPLDNQNDFKNVLGSKIIVEHQRGHFSGPSDNITELPVVLKELLRIANA
jgi:hypothetical protein